MFITNKIHINLFVKVKEKKKTHTHTPINKEKIVQKYYNWKVTTLLLIFFSILNGPTNLLCTNLCSCECEWLTSVVTKTTKPFLEPLRNIKEPLRTTKLKQLGIFLHSFLFHAPSPPTPLIDFIVLFHSNFLPMPRRFHS
jgi:hypothetical protein